MSTWEPPTGPIQLPARPRGGAGWVVACVAVAALLVVVAFWLRSGTATRAAAADGMNRDAARLGQAQQAGVNTGNDALSDPKRTREATDYVTTAIEATFSYDYANLAATEQAVDEHLEGEARCAYDALFGEVKQYATEQHIVLGTTVREVALVTLTDTEAQALVYIDQLSTRTDVNKTVAVGGQFAVRIERAGGRWKITGFDMFDQPLFNGEPAPRC
jgi:Mce-associated membrane protein